ncbi:MAG: enoyl-CoA hydratase-related protein [Actinomycetota bacterium]|nr:enoyl-CoA hydratase-related protein [Actinomycetota bacterium]
MAIELTVDEHIATITINRPERLNALDAEAYEALSRAWIRVRDDDEIRVAVITGQGDRAFCVGADLKSFITSPHDLSQLWKTQQDPLLNRGLEVWKPVVAAVNGYCLGGGMTLLLATDIRVTVPHATFGLSEVKRGILPGNGGTQRLLSQLPHAIGMEMLLTGDSIDAETASKWGLVNKIVDPGELMNTAMEYARKIASNAPLAVQAAKEAALRSREMGLGVGLRMEEAMNRLLKFTQDASEGPAAFSERRDPRFEGR